MSTEIKDIKALYDNLSPVKLEDILKDVLAVNFSENGKRHLNEYYEIYKKYKIGKDILKILKSIKNQNVVDFGSTLFPYWLKIFKTANLKPNEVATREWHKINRSDVAQKYISIGIQCENKKEYKEAYKNYKLALENDPTWYKPYFALGGLMGLQNNYKEALKYYQTGLILDPNSTYLLVGVAQSYLFLKQYRQAIFFAQKAKKSSYSRRILYHSYFGLVFGSSQIFFKIIFLIIGLILFILSINGIRLLILKILESLSQ